MRHGVRSNDRLDVHDACTGSGATRGASRRDRVMNHRHHTILLVAAAGLAVSFLVVGNGGLALVGVGLALLICPLVMGVVMWLLMRQPQSAPHQSETELRNDHAATGQ
jgi:hypothetical protein